MKKNAKTAIINSFKQLLTKKSIDKLTVKEICEHCNVNRQTFYNHFTDIMDVFKFIFFEELSADIAQNRTFETWGGGFLATMNYLKKNSKMILHVYNSSYWYEFNTYFTNLSTRLLDDVVDECVEKTPVKLKDKDHVFIVNFYRHVFNGLIIDWVSEGMEEEPEILLKKLLTMITGSIPRSVLAFEEEIKE
ncbi:TetR/AcrR family transcriptional regulator C-terminal domain-containing protein [Clostridium tagluense]|uniref:TetR/AcrR family transcriptional regulator C-terminal domain-containing protein n=1 Tax=Clostridium tagluense TaxID=360422 RepID=UPI001C0B799F|nr:TetR/AcrR family transcriptional regulator C-terminal domain-containing protein [Clostridium tagluense]MBU3129870.1 TetR/AcrR family transcriptional regulator C-terminal domain-containing protein [Clostridium tagluense]MCB2312162.1 TetR/AcrR family transcriptional regulator C-terminal domain-containing protein [Clostridium tagluense]MCB2316653.1 TetR/AcrR family transcriptional regulator C-terminal domain-containing protein [Clostridium tagluense]MCB2321609.1 TetR/AcrR family transcriptional